MYAAPQGRCRIKTMKTMQKTRWIFILSKHITFMNSMRQPFSALFSLFLFSSVVSAASFEFHAINVGQGDSLLVKSPEGKLMLIDCGNNGKGATVINYLKSLGVTQIDFLVASHYDADHIGGCDEVLNSPEVSVIEV